MLDPSPRRSVRAVRWSTVHHRHLPAGVNRRRDLPLRPDVERVPRRGYHWAA